MFRNYIKLKYNGMYLSLLKVPKTKINHKLTRIHFNFFAQKEADFLKSFSFKKCPGGHENHFKW